MSRTSEELSLFLIYNLQRKTDLKAETITVTKEPQGNNIPYENFTDSSQKVYIKEEVILPDDIEMIDDYQELNVNMEINALLNTFDTGANLAMATKSKAIRITNEDVVNTSRRGKKRKRRYYMVDHYMESYCVKCKKIYHRTDFRRICRICRGKTKYRCGFTECRIEYEAVPELKNHVTEANKKH